MPKPIAIIGTLDTKGQEVGYIRDLIQRLGCQAWVIDPGVLGQPAIAADCAREAVARAGGSDLDDLIAAGDKGRAIQTMIDGTRAIVVQLYAEGKLGGVIAVGGGQGTAIGTTAMQALPIGVPKVMISTIASGQNVFEPYVGTTDVTLMHSVADILGINTITRKVFANAAAAVVAMVEASESIEESDRTTLGATMLGLTTPCVLRAKELLDAQGYELVAFHPNGTGGRSMERLIDAGVIQGVMDISTQELTGHVCHGLFDAGPDRLTAAGRHGIPQVVAPGGTDYVVLGPLSSLTGEQRSRALIIHNPNMTLVRTAKDEMAEIGRLIAGRLNAACGPTSVLIPMGGFSYSDRPGHAFYDPEADAALIEALETELAPQVQFFKVDAHINDPAFAEAVAGKMRELMER
ncbi:MAG TPA: Tm-1-like ATP-binding domain-containing protein [Anaerolineae bacterium]|nr:Tm-1-like ATP-binding domain-containing protein [Anaerolineae bacterium]